MFQGRSATYEAGLCQFSDESDGLIDSCGAVDGGQEGEKINSFTPSGHSAPFFTNSWSTHDFIGSFFPSDSRFLF